MLLTKEWVKVLDNESGVLKHVTHSRLINNVIDVAVFKASPTQPDIDDVSDVFYLKLGASLGVGTTVLWARSYTNIEPVSIAVVPTVGSTSVVDGVVDYFADLPPANTQLGQVYLVLNSTGVVFTKQSGLYLSNGTAWNPLDINYDAEKTYYNNIASGLSSLNVKAAIDEVVGNVEEVATTVADNTIKINTNTQAIANLATAQAVFSNTTGLALTATEQNLPFTVDVPSTDSNVMVIDDPNNHVTFNITAAYNFKTDMNFAVNTPQARAVTIRGRRVSDGQLIYSRTVDILQANGTIKSVSTNTLLTLGKNGVPSAPFDIYFTIQCSDTGISMIDFTSLLASSTSIYTQRGLDTLTTSGAISSANSTVFINASTNSTFTLSDATEASGLEINIKRIDNTNSSVNVDTTGVQTIDGNEVIGLLPYQNIRVISNGVNWYII